jgi:hypothetical protein
MNLAIWLPATIYLRIAWMWLFSALLQGREKQKRSAIRPDPRRSSHCAFSVSLSTEEVAQYAHD